MRPIVQSWSINLIIFILIKLVILRAIQSKVDSENEPLKQLGKHLSVGLTSSYYFGSANIKTAYAGDDLTQSLIRQEYKIKKPEKKVANLFFQMYQPF